MPEGLGAVNQGLGLGGQVIKVNGGDQAGGGRRGHIFEQRQGRIVPDAGSGPCGARVAGQTGARFDIRDTSYFGRCRSGRRGQGGGQQSRRRIRIAAPAGAARQYQGGGGAHAGQKGLDAASLPTVVGSPWPG